MDENIALQGKRSTYTLIWGAQKIIFIDVALNARTPTNAAPGSCPQSGKRNINQRLKNENGAVASTIYGK